MTTITCKFTPAPKPAPGRTTKVRPQVRGRANPVRVARMLALAYHVEDQIAAGSIVDYAAAAAALGVTRARLSQIMSLLLLAPEIQGGILRGDLCASERDLRAVSARALWPEQLASIEEDHRRHVDAGTDDINT